MNDEQLLRYSAHILLPQVGIEGVEYLRKTRALLFGIGGLGAVSALYLASSGVGELILVDFDRVELSNLQRQIIYNEADIGRAKVEVAKEKLNALNPTIKITTIFQKLNMLKLLELVSDVDIVLDGTDNFASRFTINEACVSKKVPLVSAAVIGFEGQVSVFCGYKKDKPCYRCLYEDGLPDDNTCAERGVLSSVAGLLGTMQATQTLKFLLNLGTKLEGELLLLDALSLQMKKIRIPKDKSCPVCKF